MAENNEASLIAAYHQAEDYFFTSISQATQHFKNYASAYLTGVEAGSLNLLIIKQPDGDIGTVLKDGVRFFEDAGLPFIVLLPEDAASKLANQLNTEGLTAAYNTVAMQLSMKNFMLKNSHSDVFEIRCTNECLSEWALPLESAFESNPTLMMQYRLRHQAAIDYQKQFSHFSLYVKNHPVCSLTLSVNNGLARLDDIGTDIEFQGRGYASALIQHTLELVAASTVSHCFLDASSQGASLYRRTGFSTLFNYASFHRG